MKESPSVSTLSKESLEQAIDSFVESSFLGYKHNKIKNAKVIHDSVHGTNIFRPYEIAFLDLPIIQRLRRISQTDVASLVFPAGNHNRFEHTVGVAVVAGQMVESIFLKCKDIIKEEQKDFIYRHCRIAAILHDSGHGPFSHLSEQVYISQFKKIRDENPIFSGARPHEIISHFIATSAFMKKFNEDVIEKIYGISIDLDFVGEMIVGYINKDIRKEYGFAIQIINGAFDADKLDYILRDAHATGIRMALDLPRLMHTLSVIQHTNNITRLAIDISGVSALEEIVFNKMMLTSTIYHHQKVRAAGCMLKGIILKSNIFGSAFEWLKYTDDMIYNMSSTDETVIRQLTMLKNRMLPKRAFCVSSRTLEDSYKGNLSKLIDILDNSDLRSDIIENIVCYIKEKFNKDISKDDIWMDCPDRPKFNESSQCLIKSQGSKDNYLVLNQVFPIEGWVRAFSENKWHGYVYTLPEYCKLVSIASKFVLEEIADVRFNEFATYLCKIDDDDIIMT